MIKHAGDSLAMIVITIGLLLIAGLLMVDAPIPACDAACADYWSAPAKW